MTNTLKLKAAIVASGSTRASLADEMGISLYSLHKKIHNKSEFKASEIAALVKLLNIVNVSEIFFSQNGDFKSSKDSKERVRDNGKIDNVGQANG